MMTKEQRFLIENGYHDLVVDDNDRYVSDILKEYVEATSDSKPIDELLKKYRQEIEEMQQDLKTVRADTNIEYRFMLQGQIKELSRAWFDLKGLREI